MFFHAFTGWFAKGGVIMWPILLFAVYGVALCIERWRHYRKKEQAVERGLGLLPSFAENPTADFRDKFGSESAVARLARIVLENGAANNDARAEKTRIAFTNEQARIEKHLGIISVVATLLPLLGLLGTVTGMIASFNAIAAYGSGNPSVVADGIAEALITTEAGLITSIPLLYLHQVLSNRADTLARRLDEFTTHLLHIFIREEK
jgi:biopolymer transport protein ExbB